MGGEETRRVIITVGNQHLPTIDSVVKGLEAAGLQVNQVMPSIGIIAGEVSLASMRSLEAVPGVAAVELDQEMRAI